MPTNLECLAHPKAAVEYLGRSLFDGSLSLLLGAGFSVPLGFPPWEELLRLGFSRIKAPPYTGGDLELGATALAAACKAKGEDYKKVVTSCLYPSGGLLASDLMRSSRMSAVGAMLTGSRRGNVNTVLTLNFDSLLEEYLQLHGYVVRVVAQLPALTGSEDVTIFHPHGYLPSETGPGKSSRDIKFTMESFLKMAGDLANPWSFILRQIVRSKILLLVGVSARTVMASLGSILSYEAEFLTSDRPSAFWIGAETLSAEVRQVFESSKVVPVNLRHHDDTDPFLLETCREAAKLMPGAII